MAETHPEIGLMLLATAAGLVLWWLARGDPVWRWGSLGMLAWGLQAGVWLLERSQGLETAFTPSDALLLIATLAWIANLRQLRPVERPRLTLALTPFLVMALVGTLYSSPTQFSQLIWWVHLLPLLFALPALEAALKGHASEARLIWGLGLLLNASGGMALSWLGETPIGFVYFIWALGHILIGWGGLLEAKDARIGKVLLGFILTGLLGSLVLLGAGLQALSHPSLVAALSLWAGVVAVALGALGWVVYQRVGNAERQLELWVNLLETLSTKPHSTQQLTPQGVLQSVLDGLKPLFGNLVGLEVRSDVTIRVGQSGPYVHTFELALEHPTEGRLFFSGPPPGRAGAGSPGPLAHRAAKALPNPQRLAQQSLHRPPYRAPEPPGF